MSIYDKATLVQIPSGYKASGAKLYSVLPANGDGDFTVSADADATRIDENGLVESTAANQARLSRNFIDGVVQPDPFLLLEPTRQNLFQRSEDFSNSYWTKDGSSISTGIVSPTGGSNAQNIVEDTSTGRHRVRVNPSVSSGTTYSFSVWAKSSNRNLVLNADFLFNARSGFNLSTGSIENTTSGSAKMVEYPNDWYLCTITGTASVSHTQFLYIQMQEGTTDVNYTGDGSSTLSIFGAQLETGSYPTSYISTSASAVTRTADDCTLTGFSDNLGQTEGVLFIDMDNFGQAGTSYGSFLKIYEDGDSTDRVIIQNSAEADNRIILVVRANSSTLFQPREDIPTGRNKIALKYKSGDIDVFLNGTKIETSSSTFTFANTLNKVQIGQPNKVYQAMIFNEALSDSELENLTSYDSFGQMAKALLYTIE